MSYDHPHPNLIFLGALIFGQFIPVIMLFASFDFPLVRRWLEKLHLDPDGVRVFEDSNQDPLKFYLESKLKAHGLRFFFFLDFHLNSVSRWLHLRESARSDSTVDPADRVPGVS